MECISNKFLVDCADKMVYMCILCTEMTASNAKRQCNEKKKPAGDDAAFRFQGAQLSETSAAMTVARS